ncbi:ANTAR domain-containing protein [Lentzea sp. NPDC054927]
MDGQRRDRLTRAVEEFTSAVSGRAALAQALCVACLHVLPGVGAAALTLRANARAEEMIGASDEWAARLEEIQYTLGEGPGVAAFQDATPVLVADLGSDGVRWPGFSAAAAAEGLTAMFAFPLQAGGIRLGTLDLYRRRAGGLTAVADAAMLADLATCALLEQSALADDELRMTLSYQDVNMATGMLAAQLRISLEDAFARLRAHAFSSGRSVLDVARDLLARRIPLDRLAD